MSYKPRRGRHQSERDQRQLENVLQHATNDQLLGLLVGVTAQLQSAWEGEAQWNDVERWGYEAYAYARELQTRSRQVSLFE